MGMIDLDGHTIEVECPRWRFYNPITLKQVRLRDAIICRGCKVTIQLEDHMNETRKAIRSIKHRSEWFYREQLWQLASESQKGEKLLALDLYAYLYDQGINFSIEPSSLSGAIDLIAAQHTDDPL